MVSFYLDQKDFSKCFTILSTLRDLNNSNALVRSLIVIFHARLALETNQINLSKSDQKLMIEEAVSMGDLVISQEEDQAMTSL